MSSNEFHSKSIQALDNKKITVIELSSYLLIITGIIFLEKILLTLTGYVTFTFLVSASCLLWGIYLFVRKDILKNLAIKLAIFGLVIFMVVPISIKVSDLIESTYQESINQTIEEANNIENETLSNFIDAIAILLITSCVIPIVVLIFFIWIIKIIFGISIPVPNIKKPSLNDNKKENN